MPWLMLFIFFNGYFVTLKSVQPWMDWAIHISPFFYSMQEIAVSVFGGDSRGGGAAADAAEAASGEALESDGPGIDGHFVLSFYGFKSHKGTAVAVLLTFALVLRTIQVLALKYKNGIVR